ncbi:MAG: NAD(P)-dependent alcohol dehydrogenase [Ilumatobacteraceae bacterium]
MKVTAAVIRDPQAPYSIEQLDLREPGPGEVLVKIAGVGMCHTDVLPRIPDLGLPLPMVCGHEGSGVVEAVGPGVTAVAPGDHVVMSYDSCGACTNCRTGHPAYCETFMLRNLTGFRTDLTSPLSSGDETIAGSWFGQSSFASHSLATERNVVKVADDLPLELLGPLGCGLQTGAGSVLVAMKARPGTSIAVFGTGAVGMSAVMAAKVAGCATIVGVDLNEARLQLARELGATHTFNGADPDLADQLLSLTGDGLQYAFDTTGVPDVILTAIGALRQTGTCGLVGVQIAPLEIAPNALAAGKNVMGILEGDAIPQVFIPELIALWRQGRFPFERLIGTFAFEDIDRAEQSSLSGETIKPVLSAPT